MKKNDFVNMWLGLMLRRMKKRVGFVNLVSAEGHIRKHVFSDDVDDSQTIDTEELALPF